MSRKSLSEWTVIIGVYSVLTLLVWGLFALDRGLWQDELIYLTHIHTSAGSLFDQLSSPIGSPTRVLAKLPYWISYKSGHFVLSLQALYGLMWLVTGVLGYLIILRLFPHHQLLAYIAGALTLTATSDFLVNSLVPLSIGISVAFYFAAVFFLLSWWQGRSLSALILSCVFLSCSLWMYDAAFFSVLLTPVLLWAHNRFRISRRVIKAAIIWYIIVVPYVFVFARFLTDPGSYAARAIRPLSVSEWVFATYDLVINNVKPWVWAFYRRQWFPALSPMISPVFKTIGSLIGTIAFVGGSIWFWRKRSVVDGASRTEAKYVLGILAVCAIMVVGSNATYAPVHFSSVFYRTHWVSRVWSSMAITVASYGAFLYIRETWRPAVLLVPSLFVFMGTYGGLERQDYYLGYWKQHKKELRSILEQVPGLRSDAYLILYTPPEKPYYLATEAAYLASAWVSYLYGDPSLPVRVFLWSPARKASCSLESDSFVCVGERKEQLVMPINKSVLLEYLPSENRYALVDKIPDEALPGHSLARQIYNPKAQILQGSASPNAGTMLYNRDFLASFLRNGEKTSIENVQEVVPKYDPSRVNMRVTAGSVDICETLTQAHLFGARNAVHAAGWAYDPKVGKPAKFVLIVDKEKVVAVAPVKVDRRDVASAKSNEDLLKTGWDTVLTSGQLGKGKHDLAFYAVLFDGSLAPLQTGEGKTRLELDIPMLSSKEKP